jgi:sarcosine dehydrogenase
VRDNYFIVTATAQATKDLHYIQTLMSEGIFAHDVTSAYSVLSVMGPNSIKLLQNMSTSSFANEDLFFGTSRDVDIGLFNVTAKRITYVGELGWELYIPVESARGVYDALW